jgi:hypothetical protein
MLYIIWHLYTVELWPAEWIYFVDFNLPCLHVTCGLLVESFEIFNLMSLLREI